ncbi:hypothetical protein PIB30_046448 [Stylosanthes scabra]|uniref:NIF system FeS cluster assembly NifU N-terminal domain-containing protein n=1 Tax=Stylosanthes scabra TaxID=79078 RepID=A0ABU6ZF79_9FABA|nr:hypothetical protein [Stylosanthes scabra]
MRRKKKKEEEDTATATRRGRGRWRQNKKEECGHRSTTVIRRHISATPESPRRGGKSGAGSGVGGSGDAMKRRRKRGGARLDGGADGWREMREIKALMFRTSLIKLQEEMTNELKLIAKHLSLPLVKLHYSMLAEDAIKSAIKDYEFKHASANGNGKAST